MNCIFWACLYLSGGIADAGHHATAPVGSYYAFDINDVRNPYGIAEIGWSNSYGRWNFEIAARHISSLAVDVNYGDFKHQFGMNTAEVRVRWFPFRR